MAQQQKQRTQTSTQIRNFYANGMAYLNVKFYNTYLSFSFSPFMGNDPGGRGSFDTKNAQTMTIDYIQAYALYETCQEILQGKTNAVILELTGPGDAKLVLDHHPDPNGQAETTFRIERGGVIIPFRFQTIIRTETVNGTSTAKVIHAGLGAFAKTIDGYLTGINADRHLDKLTDDYVALQNQQPQQQRPYNGGGYQKQYPNQKQPYQQKPYQKQYNQKQYPNQGGWQPPQQQRMGDYRLPN